MTTKSRGRLGIFLACALVTGFCVEARAEDNPKGLFGARIGVTIVPSKVYSDPTGSIDADPGFVLNGHGYYLFHPNIGAGLELEYGFNSINLSAGGSLGKLHTITFLPAIQVRASEMGTFTPYGVLGVGFNINIFSESSAMKAAGRTVDPDHTFAFKVGAGAELAFANNMAGNLEFGYKLNNGDTTIADSCGPISTDGAKAHTLYFQVGVRFR